MKLHRLGLAVFIACLSCALFAGEASAASKLSVKSVKIAKATGGVGSVVLSGSVSTSAKTKSIGVSLKLVSGKLPAQSKSVKATSKKAAKSLKFSVTLATAFVGEVQITATAMKKTSKSVKAIVLAPVSNSTNPGGTITTPPPGGQNPPVATALGLKSIEIVTSRTCGMIDDSAYCGGSNGTFDEANPGTLAGLGKVGGAFAAGVISSVDAGEDFACGVKAAEAYCWGRNYEGELGIGRNDTGYSWSQFPVKPVLPAGAVTQVSAGDTQACAIVGGAVYCWGYGSHGQLGNGATSGYVTTPVAVAGMTGVSRIVALDTATCAIKSVDLYCWGYNKSYRLDPDASTNGGDQTTPKKISTLPSGTVVPDVAIDDGTTCVLTSAGKVLCWGSDAMGQLGNGDPTTASTTPVTPTDMDSGVTSLSGSFYGFCAVKAGAAYCWGNNWNGQIGDGGAKTERHYPVQVNGLGSGVASISAGTWSTCAVMTSTAGYCWGKGSAYQLVNGSNGDADTPSPIVKLETP